MSDALIKTKPLRIGIIGLGVGEQYIRGFSSLPECSVTTLCDFSDDKLKKASQQYPQMKLTKSDGDVLTNPDIDVVAIASFDDMHHKQVVQALENGKHVFVEKPMCRTVEEASVIKSLLVKKRGTLKLASNLVLRSAPVYRWLKEQIQAGEFGEIYAFDGDYLYGRLEKITEGWRKDVENYSVMQGGGVHLIDLMLWMTGQRPETVYSIGNNLCAKGTNFKYHDFVSSSMKFASGMVGRLTANFGCVHRHHHVVRVFGTKKTFVYDDAGPRVHTTRDPQQKAEFLNLQTLPSTKAELIPGFVREILNGGDALDSAHVFLDGISVCAASDQSLKTETVEKVRYI